MKVYVVRLGEIKEYELIKERLQSFAVKNQRNHKLS